jgi:hypothetical protein
MTWPVLELLGNNAEFFLARHSPKVEILLLGVVLALGLPAFLAALGSLPGKGGNLVGLGLIAVLSTLLGFLYLRRLPVPWWTAAATAILVGSVATWAFLRFDPARQATRYLLPAPLLFLAIFLFATPSGAVLLDRGSGIGTAAEVGNPVPIVMIVLDEFPLASIIDPEGNLRGDRYPNLARLAADGTWFRNAVTVEQQTEHSLPAMLTGYVPDQSTTPFAGQHPNNLFTALQGSFDLHVHETITRMCPVALCETLTRSTTPIARDVGVVAGHVLLPEPLTADLPEIDRSWGDFGAASADFDMKAEFRKLLKVDARLAVDALVADIAAFSGEQTPLYFLHALVPHHPWQFLPDGRVYPLVVEANPAAKDGGWIDDDFLVAQTMQRHLLQVGYADHAVGEVIEAMEQAGIYESSLMIVVADHGVAIKPGVPHQRMITESTIGEIAAVPLFVKAPGVATGVIDDRRALTIDILPTIAETIEAQLAWDVEGVSLFGPAQQRSGTTTVGPQGEVSYGVGGEEKLVVADRIERWFPGGDPWALRPAGAPDLLGARLDVAALGQGGLIGRIRQPQLYADVDTSGDVIPARVAGTLSGTAGGEVMVAVVVNGVVGAITRSHADDDGVEFLALIPPDLLQDGKNRIELAQILPEGEVRRIDGG